MRILVVEATRGSSDDLVREAENAGHDVLRCQPLDDTVRPCLGYDDDEVCPFTGRVDVVVDVHASRDRHITPRELGLACAVRNEVPVVVAGHSPVGASATETEPTGALAEAEKLARRYDGVPPPYAVERRVREELADRGLPGARVGVSYIEQNGVLDVVVDIDQAFTVVDEAALDSVIRPLFFAAAREHRFGDVVYEGDRRSRRALALDGEG